MHKSLGKKVWKLDKLESNFKHSPMCSSGTVLHAMPHTLPHGMPHTLPHGMPHAMSHSMFTPGGESKNFKKVPNFWFMTHTSR